MSLNPLTIFIKRRVKYYDRKSPTSYYPFYDSRILWVSIHQPPKCSQNVTTLGKSSWLLSCLSESQDPINLINHLHDSIHSLVLELFRWLYLPISKCVRKYISRQLKIEWEGLPGGPMTKTLHSQCTGLDSIPGQEQIPVMQLRPGTVKQINK